MNAKKKMPCYKCCAVPMCKSTTISTPQKLFIQIPIKNNVKRNWLILAGRHPTALSRTSTSYFCEDHFNLQNDMENYIQYTTMGAVQQVKLKPGCLPTKFACQQQSTITDTNPIGAKRKRLTLTKASLEMRAEALKQSETVNFIVSSEHTICKPSTESTHNKEIRATPLIKIKDEVQDPVFTQQEITKIDKAIQVHIAAKFRSKSTQTQNILHLKKTSPKKLSTRSVSTSPFKITELSRFMKPKPFLSGVTGKLQNVDK